MYIIITNGTNVNKTKDGIDVNEYENLKYIK